MTREQTIKMYMISSKETIAEMLYDTITRYESRTCDECIHKPKEGGNFADECGSCSRFYADGWEMKVE